MKGEGVGGGGNPVVYMCVTVDLSNIVCCTQGLSCPFGKAFVLHDTSLSNMGLHQNVVMQ